jgi:hypothetical protein
MATTGRGMIAPPGAQTMIGPSVDAGNFIWWDFVPLDLAACVKAGRIKPPNIRRSVVTKALLAFGGITQHCRRCGLRRFF